MEIDITRHLGAVSRTVGERMWGDRRVRFVSARRTFDTTLDDLWEAISSPERLPRWFLPVSGELRPGGRYRLEGNAEGEILACDPPRRLAMTWEWGGMMSWVEVELAEEEGGGGAVLHLQHMSALDEPDPHWEQFGPSAGGVGWDMALMGLALHLETGAPNDPEAAAAWAASENARGFMAGSAQDWSRAHVESGADPEEARGAAARTVAFYTGEAPEGGAGAG